MSSPSPSAVGRKLLDLLATSPEFRSDFVVTEFLGEGGMGVVFRARQKSLDRDVAIKCIRTDELGDDASVERFMREAAILASLEHPGIVRIFTVDQREGLLFIVSEFVAGRTLKARLAEGPLPRPEGLRLVVDVAGILGFVHARGMVHRDVKPENVILPTAGGVKLIDFGLARQVAPGSSKLTRAGEFLGTPGYLAPEIIRHQEVSPRSDVYALGVMLFEVLAGRRPFDGPALDVLLAHVKSPVPSLRAARPDLPQALEEFVRRAMAKHAEERPADGSEFAEELAKLAGLASAAGTRQAPALAPALAPAPVQAPAQVPVARRKSAVGPATKMAKSSDLLVSAVGGAQRPAPARARGLLAVASLAALLVLGAWRWREAPVAPAAAEQPAPRELTVERAARGAVRVRWSDPGGTARLDVVEAGGRPRRFDAGPTGALVDGLTPGASYRLTALDDRGRPGATRSFEGPWSGATVVGLEPAPAPGGRATLRVRTGGRVLLAVTALQGTALREWCRSPRPAVDHELVFGPLDGAISAVRLVAREDEGSEPRDLGVPTVELAALLKEAAAGLDRPWALVALRSAVLGPEFRRLPESERSRQVRDALFEDRGVRLFAALAAFAPVIFGDPDLPLEERLRVFDSLRSALPIDLLGKLKSAGQPLGVEASVASFSRLEAAAATEGTTLRDFDADDNNLIPLELTGAREAELRAVHRRFLPRDVELRSSYRIDFALTQAELASVREARLVMDMRWFSPAYVLYAVLNDGLVLPFHYRDESARQFTSLGAVDLAYGCLPEPLRRSFPPAFLRPGPNTVRLECHALLGEAPAEVPGLISVRLKLVK